MEGCEEEEGKSDKDEKWGLRRWCEVGGEAGRRQWFWEEGTGSERGME